MAQNEGFKKAPREGLGFRRNGVDTGYRSKTFILF